MMPVNHKNSKKNQQKNQIQKKLQTVNSIASHFIQTNTQSQLSESISKTFDDKQQRNYECETSIQKVILNFIS